MKNTDLITKIVIYTLLGLVLFTIVNIIIFCIMGATPDTLIQWVFTVFGLELMMTMAKTLLDMWLSRKEKYEPIAWEDADKGNSDCDY